MKKVLGVFLILVALLVTTTGCGKDANITKSAEEIITAVYEGINQDDMPMVMNTEITDDNISNYLGVDSLDIKEGVASEAMMNAIAHSVVVVKLNDGVDVASAKKEIKEKANPAKWICVEAESVIVESKGNTIILIMTNKDLAEKIKTNFKNIK